MELSRLGYLVDMKHVLLTILQYIKRVSYRIDLVHSPVIMYCVQCEEARIESSPTIRILNQLRSSLHRVAYDLDEWSKVFDRVSAMLRRVCYERAGYCNKRIQRGRKQVGSFARLETTLGNSYSSISQQSPTSVHMSQFEAVCEPTLAPVDLSGWR